MHVQDETILSAWLGKGLPRDLVAEINLRTRMFHSAGSSGPLPPTTLIDAVRYCGYKPSRTKEPEAPVDWRMLSGRGDTRVEAYNQDSQAWEAGVYTGGIDAGTLGVRLDREPGEVREYPRKRVRLERGKPPEEPGDPPQAVYSEEGTMLAEARPEMTDATPGPPPPRAPLVEALGLRVLAPQEEAWKDVQLGTACWLQEDEDLKDCLFQGFSESQPGLVVEVEGEDGFRVVPAGMLERVG